MRFSPLLAALPLLVAAPLTAQKSHTDHTLTRDPLVAAPPAAVRDLGWLAGYWKGSGLGGTVEEIWSAPAGGSMMGVFRLIQGDSVVFYEIMTIRPQGESLALVLKHFDADLTGWEEREEVVIFPLLRIGATEAYFEGLTLRNPAPGRMEAFVVVHGRDGSIREEAFRYTRSASP